MKKHIGIILLWIPFLAIAQCLQPKETADTTDIIRVSQEIYASLGGLSELQKQPKTLNHIPFLFDTNSAHKEELLQPGTWFVSFQNNYSYTCKVHVYKYVDEENDKGARSFLRASGILKTTLVAEFFGCMKYGMYYGKDTTPLVYFIEYLSLSPKPGAQTSVPIPICFFSGASFYNTKDKQAKGAWICIRTKLSPRPALAKR